MIPTSAFAMEDSEITFENEENIGAGDFADEISLTEDEKIDEEMSEDLNLMSDDGSENCSYELMDLSCDISDVSCFETDVNRHRFLLPLSETAMLTKRWLKNF